jgi:UDP-N-acetylmuramoyl-L-alanyl-D-glutamate--2,6-diaminopimelate ligase
MHLEFPKIFPVTAHTDHVGPGTTFVAVQGLKQNGIDYITQALDKGASKIVVQEDAVLPNAVLEQLNKHHVSLLRVPNTRRALAELSAQALNYPARKLKIIGITGTKGKTTTSFILAHLLYSAGYSTALLSTIRNRINDQEFATALTTQQPDYLHVFLDLCVRAEVTHVVMEVSAQALSMNRLAGIEFDGAIFTNFSQEHAEFYPTLDDYFNAKKLLFSSLKSTARPCINVDDEYGMQIFKQRMLENKKTTAFFYTAALLGLDTRADVHAELVQANKHGIEFIMHTPEHEIRIHCPSLIGTYNLYNVLGAATVALQNKVQPEVIKQAMTTFKGVPGRMESYPLANGALCVIDYAHTPSSFQAILTTLRSMTDHLIVVFGCGGDRDPIKRPAMGRIAAELGDLIFVTSDNPRSEELPTIIAQIESGIAPDYQAKVRRELDREQAIKKAYASARSGSIIVLLGKGPDEYEEVKGVKRYFSERQIILEMGATIGAKSPLQKVSDH